VSEQKAGPGPGTRAILRLPEAFARRLSDFFSGERPAVDPRDAASVLLLRAASGALPELRPASGALPELRPPAVNRPGLPDLPDLPGIEVYLIRRAQSMAFAPGASAFPGGSVDPRDAEGDIAWAGPDAAEWGQLLDAPAGLARALVCAAVRETFEESGVLLAGPTAGSLVADTSGPDWEADRAAVAHHSLSLAQLLSRRGLVLRSDLLRPWARWITPLPEPRRYDTRFFAAALPPGQRTRHVGGEADEVAWLRPAAVIRAAREGELRLMPPTAACLAGLLPCGQVSDALRAQRDLRPVTPVIYPAEGAFWLAVPSALEYPL